MKATKLIITRMCIKLFNRIIFKIFFLYFFVACQIYCLILAQYVNLLEYKLPYFFDVCSNNEVEEMYEIKYFVT